MFVGLCELSLNKVPYSITERPGSLSFLCPCCLCEFLCLPVDKHTPFNSIIVCGAISLIDILKTDYVRLDLWVLPSILSESNAHFPLGTDSACEREPVNNCAFPLQYPSGSKCWTAAMNYFNHSKCRYLPCFLIALQTTKVPCFYAVE